MRILLITLLSSFLLSNDPWGTDLDKAKESAQAGHKLIMLNFSGSDWCGPCIRMHKELFESKTFSEYANDHLVLVSADFPRLKKHQLSPEQLNKNNKLAETYNKEGNFPFTLLLSADGKVLKTWDGYPKTSPEEFTDQIKAIVDANK